MVEVEEVEEKDGLELSVVKKELSAVKLELNAVKMDLCSKSLTQTNKEDRLSWCEGCFLRYGSK